MRTQATQLAVALSFALSCAGEDSPLSAMADPVSPDATGSTASPEAAGSTESAEAAGSMASADAAGSTVSESLRFAVVGDFGTGDVHAAGVASMIDEWQPQLILTAGDNNYPVGAAQTIDANIGAYYARYIHPYKGAHGPGAEENKFFPALGNHDWMLGNVRPHEAYFDLPGNERYYTIERGPVAFFVVDSDPHEPDGIDSRSAQARWLRNALAASDASFKVVTMHHPPYSSGRHGSQPKMQWPYKEWGADLVIAGHDHTYERIESDGLTYLVNGLGGRGPYRFRTPIPGSVIRFNEEHGAVLVEATSKEMTVRFVTATKVEIDRFQIQARQRSTSPGG